MARVERVMTAELNTRLGLWQQGLMRAKATGTALLLAFFVTVLCCLPVQAAERDDVLWQALRSDGHVALLRQAAQMFAESIEIGSRVFGFFKFFQRRHP